MSPLHSWGSPTPSAGRKSEVATSPLPSRGPKRGRKCYVPKQRGTKSELATSTLPSRGPRRGRKSYVTPTFSGIPNAKRGEKIRTGYLTPAFSGAQKRAEMLRPQTKGDKIRIGYLTPAFSGAQKRAETLCNPYILGDPQRQARGENQNWLPHPGLLGGPEEGGSATSPLPNAKRGDKIRSGPKWAHRLQTCIFSKIGNFCFVVRSCLFFLR